VTPPPRQPLHPTIMLLPEASHIGATGDFLVRPLEVQASDSLQSRVCRRQLCLQALGAPGTPALALDCGASSPGQFPFNQFKWRSLLEWDYHW
jgi:hypothetical protein